MSQETSTAAEESAAHAEFPKFPRRVTQSMVDHLDILFDFVHPYDLKRYINWVLLHYIMHEADQPDDDTKDIVQSYIMLLDWLDTADLEMESLGFGRPLWIREPFRRNLSPEGSLIREILQSVSSAIQTTY